MVGKGGLATRDHFLLPALQAIEVVVEAGVVGKGGVAVRDHFLLPAF